MTARLYGRYWFGRRGPSGYGFHATAEQIATDNDDAISGKVVLVTGAATGVGFEAARVLAKHGATVFVTARSIEKANAAADKLRALVPSANIKTLAIDLGDLKDIARAANEFLALNSPLHIHINNAGRGVGAGDGGGGWG